MKGNMPNTENFGKKNDAKAWSYVIEKLSTPVLNCIRSCATAFEMIEKLDSLYVSKSEVGEDTLACQLFSMYYHSQIKGTVEALVTLQRR